MQLLRLADVPINPRDRVYYYSRVRAVVGALVLALAAAGAFLFAWINGAWPAYYVAAVMVLCLLLYQRLILGRFRPSNWLLRATDDGLFVKFRSYLNHHFDAQEFIVLFLPYSELRSVRMVKERQEFPDRNRQSAATTTTQTILELELAVKSTEFAVALSAERARVFGKMPRTNRRMSTRYQHFPVRLVSPTLLRIEWGVVPRIQTLLDALTRHTLVRDAGESAKIIANLEQLSRSEQETRLLELAESGDTIGAIAMARRLYSCDLTEAKQFIEGLMSKTPGRM
jgi:hypothetical protein